MKPAANNERVFRMPFASVYPHYVAKVQKKGRTKEELHTVLHWLTGYDEKGLLKVLVTQVDFRSFFENAPGLHPNVDKITGVIPPRRDRSCGYRMEDIADPLMRKIRYTASAFVTIRSAYGCHEWNDCSCGMFHLDKLVDELAKGRQMEKILRK